MADSRTIAVIGGTGDLGGGLARRWARAGHNVIIGSRAAEKAEASAAELRKAFPTAQVRGLENAAAAAAADVVVLAVPLSNHEPILAAIGPVVAGKIVIDTTVPLVPPKVSTVQLPAGGPVAKATQAKLGDSVRVVSAFQNVAAAHLLEDHHVVDCDVLVCGNDADAREIVVQLAASAGMRGWHAGPIDNSTVAEALTSVLIFLNRRYKIDGAGIRITGEPRPADNPAVSKSAS